MNLTSSAKCREVDFVCVGVLGVVSLLPSIDGTSGAGFSGRHADHVYLPAICLHFA